MSSSRPRLDVDLRVQHPNLWWAFVVDIAVLFLFGAGFVLTDNTATTLIYLEAILPSKTYGWMLMLTATTMAYGFRYSDRVFRAALGLAAALTMFFTVCIGIAVAQKYIAHEPIPIGGSVFVYLFLSVQLIIQAAEPRSNPSSEFARRNVIELG